MFASTEKSQVNGKARSIHNKATKAAHRIEDDAEDVVSTIYNAASAIKDDVESLANTAGRRVREAIDTAENNVVEVTDTMTSAVRENPVQSSLIALGVGVLLGFMFRRA